MTTYDKSNEGSRLIKLGGGLELDPRLGRTALYFKGKPLFPHGIAKNPKKKEE